MKKCVYTVIINDYCKLNDPIEKKEGWDYYCITDNENLQSNIWNMIYIDNTKTDLIDIIKLSKFYKTNFLLYFNDYDIILYIDGRMKIVGNVDQYFNNLNDNDIIFMNHPDNSILDEMNNVLNHKLESNENILRLKKFYDLHNYKYDNGLFAGRVLLFKNNINVALFFNKWWELIYLYSHRDQLTLNYAFSLYSNTLKYNLTDFNYVLNNYFLINKRKKARIKIT